MRIITRSEWGAKPPTKPLQTDRLPWSRVWLHHTVTPSAPADVWMRKIQTNHQSRGWRDFAYNYAFSQDGQCFEGIGLHRHLNSDAGSSATLVLLGNFETDQPSKAMIDTVAWWLAHALLQGWVLAVLDGVPHLTGGHQDIPGQKTLCPGKYAMSVIREINDKAASIIYAFQGIDLPPVTTQPTPTTSGGDAVQLTLPVLKRGSKGGPVATLQAILYGKHNQDLGRAGADGDYGALTEQAVRNVQRFFQLPPTGIVDADTWGVMFL